MSDKYIANPNVTYRKIGENCTFYNHFQGISFTTPHEEIIALFEQFRVPKHLNDLNLSVIQKNAVDELITRYMLLKEGDEENYLKYGLLDKVSPSIGEFAYLHDYKQEEEAKNIYGILGLPFDLGSYEGGSRIGPKLIRQYFERYSRHINEAKVEKDHAFIRDFDLRKQYDINSLRLVDFGDIPHHFAENHSSFLFKVDHVISKLFQNGIVPIILGGDHTISYFCLQSISKFASRLGIIHFDAHHDIYLNSFQQRNYLNHGNFLYHVLSIPSVERVHNIGARTVDYLSKFSQKQWTDKVRYTSSMEASTRTPEQVFSDLPNDISYYVTFDVDVLYSWIATETYTPVVGGIDHYKILSLIEYLTRNHQLIGFDFVELQDNQRQKHNIAADLIARYLFTFVMGKQPFKNDF